MKYTKIFTADDFEIKKTISEIENRLKWYDYERYTTKEDKRITEWEFRYVINGFWYTFKDLWNNLAELVAIDTLLR